MQLTNGNQSSDGLLEILYQGEWYTTCRRDDYNYYSYYYYYHYYYTPDYNNHADIVCKELGYDKGAVAFNSRQRVTSEYRYQLWYYDLYCEGTEDSLYDCVSHYDDLYYSCNYIAEYSCQSMNTIAKHELN